MSPAEKIRAPEHPPQETTAKVEHCRALLEAQDADFVEAVRGLADHYAAAEVADLWKADSSEWAREQLLRYLDLPLDQYGQEPVIKRMFKHAEASRDDEIVATFLVAFDRCVRRDWRATWDYSQWSAGERTPRSERLTAQANRMPLRKVATVQYGNHTYRSAATIPKNAQLFSHRTRHYLRRRAWRYFRRLAHQEPDTYVGGVCFALPLYRDADLATGENILDSRSLLRIAFGRDPSLRFDRTHARLVDGAQISQLSPAPSFPVLWQSEEAFQAMVKLLTAARSHLVRRWAAELLKRDHQSRLPELSLDQVIRLLRVKDPIVSELGAELLPAVADRDQLSLEHWLELLPDDNPSLAAQLCEMIADRVDADSVNLDAALELTLRADPSIAKLGLTFLQRSELARETNTKHLQLLVQLAPAECDVMASQVVRFALVGIERIASTLEKQDESRVGEIRDALLTFFESPRDSIRNAAAEWLEAHAEQPLIADDAIFWQRVLETPFDDLRLRLVSVLDRKPMGIAIAGTQHAAWRNVLINIHRGGRLKPFVIKRLQEEIAAAPNLDEANLHALAIAAQSIRAPERRQALAAIVQLSLQSEEVRNWIERELPELKIEHVAQ